MTFLYSLTCLFAALVFGYSYFHRNKSISDSGNFWKDITAIFLTLSFVFLLESYKLNNFWLHSLFFAVYGYFLYDLIKVIIENIRTNWQEIKSKKEVELIKANTAIENEKKLVEKFRTSIEKTIKNKSIKDELLKTISTNE